MQKHNLFPQKTINTNLIGICLYNQYINEKTHNYLQLFAPIKPNNPPNNNIF